MDPFLEDPAIFPDLHDRLIAALRDAINAVLPPPYYASSASRVWIEPTQRRPGPDVNVLRPEQPGGGPMEPANGGSIATAVAVKPVIVRVPHEEFREPFLEIYARPGNERLVTTIEVLSPTNKTPGEKGRDLYVQKQKEVLNSQVHLVEIDLLRGGRHATAVPLDAAIAKAGPFDYHVCIHTFDEWEDFLVYPIRLEMRLPVLAIPLLPGDPPVSVDLQAGLDRCYDTGLYQRRTHYRERTPVPPLRPEQAAWAERLLREKGILPAPPTS